MRRPGFLRGQQVGVRLRCQSMASDLRVLLGLRVKARREALKLSRAELARRLDEPAPRVHELERGECWPKADRLAAVAEALETEPGELLRISG